MVTRRVAVASAATMAVGLGAAGAYALTRPGGSGSDVPTAAHRPACVPSGAQPSGSLPKGTYKYTAEFSPVDTEYFEFSVAKSDTVSVDDPEVDGDGRDWQQASITTDLRATAKGKIELKRARPASRASTVIPSRTGSPFRRM